MAKKGYTSRQQIENYLLITVDPSFYDQVDSWIEQAEKMVEQTTGRNFVAAGAESARVFDGDGTNEIHIDDATSVSKVEVLDTDGTVLATLQNESGKDAQIYTYPANAQEPIRRIIAGPGASSIFTKGRQNVRVTGKWGSTTAVPADIMFATTAIASSIVNVGADTEGEVQSMTIGRYSVTYKTQDQKADLERAASILQSYKRYGTF